MEDLPDNFHAGKHRQYCFHAGSPVLLLCRGGSPILLPRRGGSQMLLLCRGEAHRIYIAGEDRQYCSHAAVGRSRGGATMGHCSGRNSANPSFISLQYCRRCHTCTHANSYSNLDKYILQFGQIHLAIRTNTLDKYIQQKGKGSQQMFPILCCTKRDIPCFRKGTSIHR